MCPQGKSTAHNYAYDRNNFQLKFQFYNPQLRPEEFAVCGELQHCQTWHLG
jgi:hypothetical protein